MGHLVCEVGHLMCVKWDNTQGGRAPKEGSVFTLINDKVLLLSFSYVSITKNVQISNPLAQEVNN